MSPRFALLAAFAALPAGCWSGDAGAPPAVVAGPPLPAEAPAPPKSVGLSVTGVDPATGDAEGGTYVHVRGSGFSTVVNGRGVKLYFGSRQGELVRIADDGDMIVQAPGGSPDAVVDLLVIFEDLGEKRLPHAFTFHERPTP